MTRAAARRERLDFRIAPEAKTLIERAASTLGQTTTEFAISQLVRDARNVLSQQEITTLSDRDRRVFLSLLDSAGQPNAALKKAAKTYRRQRA